MNVKVNKIFTAPNISSTATAGGKSNVLYGSDYGIVADGVTDNTTAFNTFMAACKAGQYKGELPKGTIRFLSKPNNIDFAWNLSGKGLNTTVLLRDYDEATNTNGLLNIVDASGIKVCDMAIESASGRTGGCMISAISSATFAISGLVFENLWLSTFGSNTQVYTVYIDGSAKTTAPAGVRDVSLKNVHVFGSTNYSVVLKSVIGFSWMGGGCYPAGSTAIYAGGIQIAGVAAAKSAYININIVTCNGLNLTNCLNVQVIAQTIGSISGVSVNNDSTCSYTYIIGSLAGTLTTNWSNSTCNDIGNKMSFDGGKVRITNATGGISTTNYLEIAGSVADNSNFPSIQLTGGTGVTTHTAMQTNNSGQGFIVRNGYSAGNPNYQAMFMFTNSTPASSYTDFSNAGVSVMRLQGDGCVGFNTTSFGGGIKVIGVADCSATPSATPTAGGVLYSQSGALKWKGSAGTVTTLAPA